MDADALLREWIKRGHHTDCHWCADRSATCRYVDVEKVRPEYSRAGWMCLSCFVRYQNYDLTNPPDVSK